MKIISDIRIYKSDRTYIELNFCCQFADSTVSPVLKAYTHIKLKRK